MKPLVIRTLTTLLCWAAAAVCVASGVPAWVALLLFVAGVVVAPRSLFKGAYTGESGGPGVGAG